MKKEFNRELLQIGENIRNIRRRKGYQQERLAEEIDVSAMTISRIENGCVAMSVLTLKNISRVLDVPVDELLNGSPS